VTVKLLVKSRPLGQNHGDGWVFISIRGAREELGEVCCAIDSHVDRSFLIEVFLTSAARKFLRAVHHEQILPKFSSNTRLTKGVLCPEK
jgi:hypothetical protein